MTGTEITNEIDVGSFQSKKKKLANQLNLQELLIIICIY